MASESNRQIGSTTYMKAKSADAALTTDEMLSLIAEHARCEQARDWDGVLATMTDDAYYDFYPYRLRISGPDALVGLWTRLFPERGPIRCFDASAHLPHTHFRREYLDDDSFVSVSWSTFRAEDGTERTLNHVVRYAFVGDQLLSETEYTDSTMMVYLDQVFDDEFRALPGVTLI